MTALAAARLRSWWLATGRGELLLRIISSVFQAAPANYESNCAVQNEGYGTQYSVPHHSDLVWHATNQAATNRLLPSPNVPSISQFHSSAGTRNVRDLCLW